MSNKNVHALSTLLLITICSSAMLVTFGQAELLPPVGGLLPPVGGLLPPIGGLLPPGGGLLPPPGGLLPSIGGLLPSIETLTCLGPILKVTDCLQQIVTAVTSQKLSGVGSTCCKAIVNPDDLDCLTKVLARLPLPSLPGTDQIKALQNYCAAIPARHHA